MRNFIVVPEGLAIDAQGNYHVSDHYAAALDLVLLLAKRHDTVYLAPANAFGADREEDIFGQEYLHMHQCQASVCLISPEIQRIGYLDTLDNAVYLRKDLRNKGRWPLGPVTLICNRPHRFRSQLMFRFCGFDIADVHTSKAYARSANKMVKRLWFYDLPLVQYFYELAATAFGCCRALFLKEQH